MISGSFVGRPNASSSSGWVMVPRSIMVVAMAEAHFSSVCSRRWRMNRLCLQTDWPNKWLQP